MNWYKKTIYAEDINDAMLNQQRVRDANFLSDKLRMNPGIWHSPGEGGMMNALKELKRAFHINTIFSRLFNHWSSPWVSGYRGIGDDVYPNKYKSKEEGVKGGNKAYHNLYLLWKDEIKNAVAAIPYIPDVKDINTKQMVDPAETSRKLLPGGREGSFEGAIALAKQIEAEAHGEGGKLHPISERDYDNLLEIYNEEYTGDIFDQNTIAPFKNDDDNDSFDNPEDWRDDELV